MGSGEDCGDASRRPKLSLPFFNFNVSFGLDFRFIRSSSLAGGSDSEEESEDDIICRYLVFGVGGCGRNVDGEQKRSSLIVISYATC